MEIDYPRWLLVGLAVVVGVAVLLAAATSGAAFGLYNPAWDGTSDLRGVAADAGASVTVARNTSAYADVAADGTVAVVLAPESRYRPAEAARLRAFVEAGGTLLVAEDVGPYANPLLARVGADARVDGRILRDEQHHYRGPALPVADGVADHRYTAGAESLTLNHGTAVEPNGARPIVNTSAVAYLDGNANGQLDDAESLGPYPVVTVEAVGAGQVVVVGDPSALINVMLERPGNRAFAAAVFGAHERVLLDVSHAGTLPPAAWALLVLRDTPLLQALLGLAVVGAVGLWARWPSWYRRPAWLERAARRFPNWVPVGVDRGGPGLSPEALAAHLRESHPEWDEDRIERVVSTVLLRRGDTPGEDAGR